MSDMANTMPPYITEYSFDTVPGWPTPEEPQTGAVPIDSPLESREAVSLPIEKGPVQVERPVQKQCHEPASSQKKDRAAEASSPLRFFVVGHPDELKDKKQMRKNRMHVMHNYLDKESSKSNSKDARVHGSGNGSRQRKLGRGKPLIPGTNPNPTAPQNIFRPDASRLTPADSQQSRASLHEQSDQEDHTASKAARVVQPKDKPTAVVQRTRNATEEHAPLVGGSVDASRTQSTC